jgi:hypothetical protein
MIGKKLGYLALVNFELPLVHVLAITLYRGLTDDWLWMDSAVVCGGKILFDIFASYAFRQPRPATYRGVVPNPYY